MKPIAIIAIIAAVVVVGGACAGVAFSGVLNGGTTGPGGDDPVVPTDPVDPTPTETPTETPTPTPTDSSMSYFSPMTSSGSSGSGTSQHTHTYSDEWSKDETNHWYATTCGHDVKKDEAAHDYGEGFNCAVDDACIFCGFAKVAGEHTWGEWITTETENEYSHTCTICSAEETEVFLGITTADELRDFATAVNSGNTYAGWTVKLMNDIDLAGVDWTPIGNVVSYPSITFAGTFDGQGYTISNMKVEVSGDSGYATGGFFGSITGEVLNLNIDRATINSSHYAGGIVGYSSANVGMKIENCKVTNSEITSTPELLADGNWDNGDKAGGIIGYMAAGDVVTGCIVENTNITGYRDIGGIVGCAQGTVTNNKVKDVVLVINNDHNYKNYADISGHDAGEVVGEGTADDTNSATNVTIKMVVTSSEALADLINKASVVDVELPAGTYTLTASMANKYITIKGDNDVIIDTTAGLPSTNAATITFDGVTVQWSTAGGYQGFTHSEKVVYNNCILNGVQYLYAPTEFTRCTLNVEDGYNVWTYGSDATFEDCTFNTQGRAILVYNQGEVHNTIKVTNCIFNDKGGYIKGPKAAIETGESEYSADTTYNIVIEKCTTNGFEPNNSGDSPLWGNKDNMQPTHLSVTIDGVKVY